MVLLPFYRKKLDRSTQFGAVGYIITLYSSKSYVKSWGSGPPQNLWGSVQILRRSGPPGPVVVAPMAGRRSTCPILDLLRLFATLSCSSPTPALRMSHSSSMTLPLCHTNTFCSTHSKERKSIYNSAFMQRLA